MNVKGHSNPVFRSRGITLVEILLVISLLVVLLSFALPTAGSASARAELKAAIENVEYSIGTARNVARMTESGISLQLVNPDNASGLSDTPQRIRFSAPEAGEDEQEISLHLQEYLLPNTIRMISERERFEFDARGLVLEPGRILLVSTADESITSAIEVQ